MSESPYTKANPFDYMKYEVDRKAKIATVTLTDPTGRDSSPFWTCYEGVRVIDEWERDDDVKVVIIKSGGKNFCNGHDLSEYLEVQSVRGISREDAAKQKKVYRRTNRRTMTMLRDEALFCQRLMFSLKPTIAQVHGHCIEYGNVLHMFCDMTIASENAHFGNLGQVIGISGIISLQCYINQIGYKRAREMLTCGRTIGGKEAEKIGWINRAVPLEKLDAEVLNEAKRIAVIPIDGLVTGKAYTWMSLESQGIGADIARGWLNWFPALSITHEPGEFHMFGEIREKGLNEAIAARRRVYEPLGGFGHKNERVL
jgi:enoyl-CoA hydratase